MSLYTDQREGGSSAPALNPYPSIGPLTVAQVSLVHPNLHADSEGYENSGLVFNNTGGSVTYKIEINGSTSNIDYWRTYVSGGEANPAEENSDSMGSLITAGLMEYGIKLYRARRGPTNNFIRSGRFWCFQFYNNGSGTPYFWLEGVFTLNDKVNEITSVGLNTGGIAGGCGIGSYSSIYPIPY